MKAGTRQLPWRRGPVAYEVACRASELEEPIKATPRRFLSLRAVARLLGISSQPVRDWIASGRLVRDPQKNRVDRAELLRFVRWLAKHAEPYEDDRSLRFHPERRFRPRPYSKLSAAQVVWPKDRKALSPRELARLVGCHPSLVLSALRDGRLHGHRRTPCRWEISRRSWFRAFPFSIREQDRLRQVPQKILSSTLTRDVAENGDYPLKRRSTHH